MGAKEIAQSIAKGFEGHVREALASFWPPADKDEVACGASASAWHCTRPLGHQEGPHAHHDERGGVEATWPRDRARP